MPASKDAISNQRAGGRSTKSASRAPSRPSRRREKFCKRRQFPQALKRGHIPGEWMARLELVPFPEGKKAESFCSLLGRAGHLHCLRFSLLPTTLFNSSARCWPGMTATAETCRGAKLAIRTPSGCPRSCCSRPGWQLCFGHYRIFLERFPDVGALAAASEDAVLAAWSGLGYYRRARMLHQCAREIVRQNEGRFPRTSAALRELPALAVTRRLRLPALHLTSRSRWSMAMWSASCKGLPGAISRRSNAGSAPRRCFQNRARVTSIRP